MSENDNKPVLPANMRSFLEYLSKNPAKLTQTKNLSLKWLDEFSKATGILGTIDENGYKRHNQQEWPEVDIAAVLADIAKLTMNRKGVKIITTKGREYLKKDISGQTDILFGTYWNNLDWRYIFPYGEEEKNAAYYLQSGRGHVLAVLRDLDPGCKGGQIDLFDFSELLRQMLDLRMVNYLGQDLPDRVRDCVRQVIVEMFEELGLFECVYETKKEEYNGRFWEFKKIRSFRITKEGRRIIGADRSDNIPRGIMPFAIQHFGLN